MVISPSENLANIWTRSLDGGCFWFPGRINLKPPFAAVLAASLGSSSAIDWPGVAPGCFLREPEAAASRPSPSLDTGAAAYQVPAANSDRLRSWRATGCVSSVTKSA
jgi:hypothetical protein